MRLLLLSRRWRRASRRAWEYYLDRLVSAESGGDPATIDFDDDYPSQSGHYRSTFC